MTPKWWIALGGLGGACLLGFVGMLARVSEPERWPPSLLFVAPAAGIVLGGFLASRVPRMARPVRAMLAAVCGACFLGTAGGLLYLLSQLSTPDGPFHGLRNFVTGAVVGGIIGSIIFGWLGSRSAGSGAGGRSEGQSTRRSVR